MPVEPADTLWIGEERPGQWRAKLDQFTYDAKRIQFSPFVDGMAPEGVWAAARDHGAGMVVIDPAVCLLGGMKGGTEYGQIDLRRGLEPWLPPDDGPAVLMILHAHRERELRRVRSRTITGRSRGVRCSTR